MGPLFLVVGNSSQTNTSLLAGSGLSGTVCSSGDQALGLLRRNCYRVVFCDLNAPGVNGMELMNKVREVHPEIAFVMITEPQDLRLGILAMISGASDYILAPLHPCDVKASLHRALKRKSLESALAKHRNALAGNASPVSIARAASIGRSCAWPKQRSAVELGA